MRSLSSTSPSVDRRRGSAPTGAGYRIGSVVFNGSGDGSGGPRRRLFTFETNLRRERQIEGIAKAKKAGVYKGRKPSINVDQVRSLKAEGIGPAEIARRLGIGRASVYRALAPV